MNHELIEIKPEKRYQKLFDELIYATEKIETEDALSVVKRIPDIALYLSVRRVKGIWNVIHGLGKRITTISSQVYSHTQKGTTKEYLNNTYEDYKNKIQIIKAKVLDLKEFIIKNPKDFIMDYGPFMLAVALGFNFGSGGFDGNGGLPDKDFIFGIGHHRSVLSHGIVMGITAECAIIVISMFADIVIKKLPKEHDEFWDNISKKKDEIIKGLLIGVGIGIAYHLTIDSTLDIRSYTDLPFYAPMNVHINIMRTQAVIEWLDSLNKETDLKIIPIKQETTKRITSRCVDITKKTLTNCISIVKKKSNEIKNKLQ